MQQIAEWLEKLRLGQYTQRFADKDIDFGVLSDLTDQDLEKLAFPSGAAARFCARSVTLRRVRPRWPLLKNSRSASL